MEIPNHPAIRYLGYVDEATKWNALAGCQALIMPSPHESLSMVLLEAWSVMKPAIVNAACDVLVGQCTRSNGGLWYTDYEEFASALRSVMHGGLSSHLGKFGYEFVKKEYSWESVETKYRQLMFTGPNRPNEESSPDKFDGQIGVGNAIACRDQTHFS